MIQFYSKWYNPSYSKYNYNIRFNWVCAHCWG